MREGGIEGEGAFLGVFLGVFGCRGGGGPKIPKKSTGILIRHKKNWLFWGG